MDLSGRKIVLAVTGGIAAYKACELLRLLQKEGASVQVVMSAAATRFVTPVTFQALSGQPVFTDQFDARVPDDMGHIALSRGADAILIAPATADIMAKVAHGIGDDLISTMALARDCPLLMAPAMNRQMWENAATQRNLAMLRADGIGVFGPAAGDQACHEVGMGRMLEPAEIRDELIAWFQPKHLAGRRVLVTAGPTFEPIDPIRGITNHSSGKMGFAVARACREAGAEVTLVAGPVALATPTGVQRVDVQTAQQMYDVVMSRAKPASGAASGAANGAIAKPDIFIAVAAVADWRVAQPSAEKLKKTEGGAPKLSFAENPDILAAVAKLRGGPWCVGFAAETTDLERHAQEKRARKDIPLLVGNLGHQTFGRDDNELLIVDRHGTHRLASASKLVLARQLVGEIAQRFEQDQRPAR